MTSKQLTDRDIKGLKDLIRCSNASIGNCSQCYKLRDEHDFCIKHKYKADQILNYLLGLGGTNVGGQ